MEIRMFFVLFLMIVSVSVYVCLKLRQIHRELKKKTMEDICDYLNTENIIIRGEFCKQYDFEAHMKRYIYDEDNKIIIDLKD
jgi:hypothetical protein